MRIATLNLKHGATADGYKGNPEAVAEACENLHADVIALQEVDRGVLRSRRANLAALAAEASGMEYVFAETLKFRFGSYGNALLVRGEIDDVEVLGLGGGHRFKVGWKKHKIPLIREPRNAILASAIIDGRKISVAATHLATEPEIRKSQLPYVIGALAARPKPQVLLGDCNQGRKQVLAAIDGRQFELVDYAPTFPLPHPTKMIDHIAVNGLAIQAAWSEDMGISDHCALIADVD
jgi:endonuclease/exonuclease/phosphatase family metal-dependent hydrolase